MNFVSRIGKYRFPDFAAYGLIFLLLFTMGIMGGKFIGKNILSEDLSFGNRGRSTGASINSKQKNYLMIGIDQMSKSNPNLESIWLLTPSAQMDKLDFYPVYPTVENGIPLADSTLNQLFTISKHGGPGIAFIDYLERQIAWDHYILIDRIGFAAVMDFLNQGEPEFEVNSTLNSLPLAWQDPAGALESQAKLLSETCGLVANLPGDGKTIAFIQGIQDHFYTDINWKTSDQSTIYDSTDFDQIECDFPNIVLENR